MLEEIREYKNNSLSKRYVEYIRDKSIPLNDRWEVFKEAPKDWKNQSNWVQQFEVERKLGEISWYDDFYIEKNQTVDMVDIVERLEDDPTRFFNKGWTLELIVEFKEEILQENISSFNYDW